MNYIQFFVFLIGFIYGFFMMIIFLGKDEPQPNKIWNIRPLSQGTLYSLWFTSNGYQSSPLSRDEVSFSNTKYFTESDFLFGKVKVTCVVFISKMNYAYDVRNTWGKKCNNLFFYSDITVPFLKAKRLRSQNSWQRLCDTMRDVWHKGNVDWVIFTSDFVYVIPENIRYLVAYRDPERPYYLGHSSVFWNQLYNSGMTAFILSKGALKKIVSKFNSSQECIKGSNYSKYEDYLLGKYLSEMGIRAEDTRDEFGRSRFHLFTPAQLMAPGHFDVLKKHSKKSLYPVVQVYYDLVTSCYDLSS